MGQNTSQHGPIAALPCFVGSIPCKPLPDIYYVGGEATQVTGAYPRHAISGWTVSFDSIGLENIPITLSHLQE